MCIWVELGSRYLYVVASMIIFPMSASVKSSFMRLSGMGFEFLRSKLLSVSLRSGSCLAGESFLEPPVLCLKTD